MDRLTFEGDFCTIAMCQGEYRMTSECADGPCSQRKVWERLKAYEDTGLEPEEIEKAMEDCADTVAKNQFAISDINEMGGVDHLRELIQAEKDGRLVVHGRWVIVDDGVMIGDGKHMECSVCHTWKKDRIKTDYCPNCGARMDLEV